MWFLNALKDLVGNYMLMSAIIAWFIAQFIKIFTNLAVNKKLDFRMLFANGGMPSSHSATVLALSTAAGISCGFGSAAFAISMIFAVIVMNDAFGVRWQAGQQAQVINKIIELIESKEEFDVKLKEVIGHTPFQVFMGGVLGFIVAVVYALIYKASTGELPVAQLILK